MNKYSIVEISRETGSSIDAVRFIPPTVRFEGFFRNLFQFRHQRVKHQGLLILSSLSKFSHAHPKWVKNGFDQAFIDLTIWPMIKLYLRFNCLPSASDIALAWDEACGTGLIAERKRLVLELILDLSHLGVWEWE